MTPKEYLSQIRMLDSRIRMRLREREELRKYDGISATDYSKDKVQSSPEGEASFVKTVERIVALEAEIDKKIDEFVDLKHTIIGQIEQLQNVQYVELLQKRYIELKSLEEIAVEMRYSYQYTRAMHGYALQEFKKQFSDLFKEDT